MKNQLTLDLKLTCQFCPSRLDVQYICTNWNRVTSKKCYTRYSCFIV